jgi:hypothetical protein
MTEPTKKQLADLVEGDIVAILGPNGELTKFVPVTKRIPGGLMVDGNVYNNVGNAEIGRTRVQPATEIEVLIFQLRKLPGKAWETLGAAELRRLWSTLSAAAEKLRKH